MKQMIRNFFITLVACIVAVGIILPYIVITPIVLVAEHIQKLVRKEQRKRVYEKVVKYHEKNKD